MDKMLLVLKPRAARLATICVFSVAALALESVPTSWKSRGKMKELTKVDAGGCEGVDSGSVGPSTTRLRGEVEDAVTRMSTATSAMMW